MIHIKEDQYGELHLINKSGPYETGRFILSEEEARALNEQLTARFEKKDRDALAEHLTKRQ